MKFRRFFTGLMLLALSPALICCSGGGEETPVDTEAKLVIAENGQTVYKVVRPMNATEGEIQGALAVKRAVEAFTGSSVKITDDYLYPGETPGEYEILVGATNRAESAEAANALPENGFGVSVLNGKPVICGRNDTLLGMAVDYFITGLLGYDPASGGFSGGSGRLEIPDALNYTSFWSSPIEGYYIVYPYKEYKSREYVAAMQLRARIEELTGIHLTVTDDYEENEKEILIGCTKRAESVQIYDGLNNGDKFGGYARIGNRIQIFGITDSIIDSACDYFVMTVLGYDSVQKKSVSGIDYASLEAEGITYIDGSTGKVERLYNNILLPEVWPPRTVDFNEDKVIEIPYLISEAEGGTHPETVNIDVGRQLFVDDFLIGQTDLTTVYHSASPLDEALISFDDCLICLSHGGLVYDEEAGLLKMWFLIYNGNRYVRCMTSADGVNWEFAGDSEALDKSANYCTVLENPSPSADGSDRYIMLVRRGDTSFEWTNHYETARVPGQIYKSADGVKWKYVSESGLCGDATTLSYNSFRNKWVFCLRDYSHLSPSVKRMVRYYECSDILTEGRFGLWQAAEWQRPDILDTADPDIGCSPEFYNLCTVSYESIQLGSFQYWLGPTNEDIALTGEPKVTDIQLGYSRDGFYFSRPVRDVPFIACSREEGAWDRGYLHSLSTILITTDDELWFYYSAYKGGEKQKYSTAPYSYPSIGMAKLRRDGFASLDGTGSVTTCPLNVSGGKKYLFINAKADSLKAELIGADGKVIEGYSVDECVAFKGDSCCYMLSWENGADVSVLQNTEFRIRFTVENGEFYSFWLSESADGDSGGYYGGGLFGEK